jgi:hypothetical protein
MEVGGKGGAGCVGGVDVVEARDVFRKNLEVVEIVRRAADAFDPRGDVVEIEALGIAFPLIGRVLLGVEGDEGLEVGELLLDGELGGGGRRQEPQKDGGTSPKRSGVGTMSVCLKE